jgi:hypothetical protein
MDIKEQTSLYAESCISSGREVKNRLKLFVQLRTCFRLASWGYYMPCPMEGTETGIKQFALHTLGEA